MTGRPVRRSGQFKRFSDGIVFGPAARYARDTAAELARRRPDVVVNPTLMLGAQAATEAAGLPQALLLTTSYVVPGTGASPYGSGWAPPRNAFERARLGAWPIASRCASGPPGCRRSTRPARSCTCRRSPTPSTRSTAPSASSC